MPLLEVRDVHKAYEGRPAVDGVSFDVDPGSVLGLLGPNGAGKTTTVSMVAGLLAPDRGDVWIKGRPLSGDRDPLKSSLGLVPQELALWDELSAWANLAVFGALYDLGGQLLDEAITRWLDFVGLADRARDRVATFSGGMKRRLNLAAGLLHDPEVLLLDEPTVGVDPQSRNAIFDALLDLRDRGKAIVYTTHYMEEAERLCDRIVIVDHGRVIASDSVRGLYGLLPSASRLRVDLGVDGRPGAWLAALDDRPEVEQVSVEDGVLVVSLRELGTGSAAVLGVLAAQGVTWTHVSSERAGLESVFLQLTGRSLRD